MSVARVTEITASSPKSIEAAIESGLTRASKTLRGITGLEVVSMKAKVVKGKIQEYRVSLKITFVLEEE
jgi:flavin-binding protein dodecin